METSIPLGTSHRSTLAANIFTAIAVVRGNVIHIRHALGGICLVLGLLFGSGAEENLMQGFIALALFISAAILLGAFKKGGEA